MEFNFETGHRVEIKHQAAGELSRFLTNGSNRTMLEDVIPIMFVIWLNMKALDSSGNDTADGAHAKLF